MSNKHVGGLQVAWEWPGEEPDEVLVGKVRYVRAISMSDQPSKSAHFVIHQIQQHQRDHGAGISVRVDGRPIADVVFEGGFVDIRSEDAEEPRP